MNLHSHRYDSFIAFYRATYETSISRSHASTLPDLSLIDLEQGAGDWSDAAHPELVIAQIQSPELRLTASFGDGVHRGQFRGAHGVIVQPPNAHVSIQIDNPHRFHVLAIPYRKLLALAGAAALPDDGDFGRFSGAPFAHRDLFGLVDNLRAEAEAGNPRGPLYAEGALMMLAATLTGLVRQPGPALHARGGLAPWQVRRCSDYLNEHACETIGLEQLAALVGLSPFHFARAFKQSTGLPPHRYQLNLRIARAKALLEATDAPVTEIALAVGYESSQALARQFRQDVGVSPSEYRRERRR